MPAFVDITGQRYGRLFAAEYRGRDRNGKHLWRCVCACGRETVTSSNVLRRGTTRSCGCLMREMAAQNGRAVGRRTGRINGQASAVHGHRGGGRSPTYQSWRSMWDRCTRPSTRSYESYGGKGIRVCDRWKEFENFLEDMGERPPGTTLDRENPFEDYEPWNCRWATKEEQQRNTRALWLERSFAWPNPCL